MKSKVHTDEYRRKLEKILAECFWGDYDISVEEAETRIQEGDEAFVQFLVNRIIAQGSAPSVYLEALFPLEELRGRIPEHSDNPRIEHRLKLVHSLLFNSIPGGVRPWRT